MSLLSVIVPCYNEEESVALFYQELTKNDPFFKEKEIELELLYIDDGSKDGTVREVKKLIEQDSRVHVVSFSRNFGKEAAMFAGLEKSKGDYVVMMDVDLQDPPSLLPEMFEWIWQGYDSVATRRVTRKGEPPIRSFFARRFYHLMKKISQTEMMDGARDYRLMTRQMVDAILSMREYNRFTKGIFGWVGFKTKWLEYENVERAKGETKWNFWKLLVYSLDGITASDRFLCGCAVLYHRFFDDHIYHRAEADLRRSGVRLAFSGVHHPDDQRRTVFLYGYSGAVSGKGIHGSKTPSDLPGKRGNLRKTA